jgi:hypothetical protein
MRDLFAGVPPQRYEFSYGRGPVHVTPEITKPVSQSQSKANYAMSKAKQSSTQLARTKSAKQTSQPAPTKPKQTIQASTKPEQMTHARIQPKQDTAKGSNKRKRVGDGTTATYRDKGIVRKGALIDLVTCSICMLM